MSSAESSTPEPATGPVPGRVRWRRFAILFVPAFAAAAVMIGLTAQGVLAASISVSGSAFEVTASKLVANDGFEQFGGVVAETGGAQHPIAVTALKSAQISDLCQSVSVGGIVLKLTAGGGSTPVSASNMIIDADQLSGSAAFQNIVIGQDAGTLSASGVPGPSGGFGEQADTATFTNIRQHTWLTTAGTFTLPGFNLSLGSSTC